jgi:pyridinium-3,5-biscarboxylic acid mononucleotide synthase
MEFEELLNKYYNGNISIKELKKQITCSYIHNVGKNIAKLDINRRYRKGIPEVIYAENKDYPDLTKIISNVLDKNKTIVVSKIRNEHIKKIIDFVKKKNFYFEIGKSSSTMLLSTIATIKCHSYKIGIISGGTSDIGIAEEARLMAKAMNCESIISYDVGIAGIHRVFPTLEKMMSENVQAIVVVAGMEGALASLVTSCVNVPVIGVPTSVGYGFGSNGIAALSSMLQSCALGLTVVNIDNGIGAGSFAALIANRMSKIEKIK